MVAAVQRGESGGVVVEGAAAWRRGQWLGGLEIST
jgi:hypothetical protein